MTDHAKLLALLAERSAKRGDFVLASGKKSALYVDARMTAMSPDGQLLIGRLGLATLRKQSWPVDAVGGLTLGADPISYAIAHASALAAERGDGEMVRAFTVRKALKEHGTGKLIEGPFRAGDHVVIIEDVITTGASALKAVQAVKNAGGQVEGVLALVDREEGGRDVLEDAGLNVLSLAKARDIVALLA